MNKRRKNLNIEKLSDLKEIEMKSIDGGSVVAKLFWAFGRAVHALGDATKSNDVQYNHVGRGM